MLGPIAAIATSFKNYANFKGRATRAEFWWFLLFYKICFHGAQWIGQTLEIGNAIAGVVNLSLILPLLSVQVRRLHDIGWSGWWVFGLYASGVIVLIMSAFLPEEPSLLLAIFGLALSTFVMVYVLFVIAQFFRPSDAKDNKYGPYGSMTRSADIAEPRKFVPQEYVPQPQTYVPQNYVPYG